MRSIHEFHALLPRLTAVLLSNMMMGFATAWVFRIGLGSDPCSTMNAGIASHLPISYGTWSLLLNTVLLLAVFKYERRLLGIGTICNMVLCGYAADFFGWCIDQALPAGALDSLALRALIAVPVLVIFILAAAVYMSMDLGVAPYDALPYLLSHRTRLSFRQARTIVDVTALAIGIAAGAAFGPVTVVMACSLGTAISWVSRQIHGRLVGHGHDAL